LEIPLSYEKNIIDLDCGPGSSGGIAPGYGLDGPGSNPGGDKIFHPADRSWGPPSLLQNRYRVFSGGKVRPGRAADNSPPSSAPGHGTVELYLYPPSGSHRACNGITLSLSFLFIIGLVIFCNGVMKKICSYNR